MVFELKPDRETGWVMIGLKCNPLQSASYLTVFCILFIHTEAL